VERAGEEYLSDSDPALIEAATQRVDDMLAQRPDAVTIENTPEGRISTAQLACYIDVDEQLLDTSFVLQKTEPADGSPANYMLTRPQLPGLPLSTIYRWQAGDDRMNATLCVGDKSENVQAPAVMAALQLQHLNHGTVYDPLNEVRICSIANTRQRLVKRTTLVKLGQKVGWYF
jgi:hypothetical protein